MKKISKNENKTKKKKKKRNKENIEKEGNRLR